VFTDYGAQGAERLNLSLRDLVARLRDTTADTKADLPWLKLAAFGDERTAKGSLRHDKNVLAIDGVEADYDGERISPETVAGMLQAADLGAIIYTSPSHTEEKPRWRVLCPTSKALPPAERAALVARLNGVLSGELAGESFTLSQAFYFGSVNSNPAHRVITVDGRAIDQATDLVGLGKRGKTADAPEASLDPDAIAPMPEDGVTPDSELIGDIISCARFHEPLRELAAKYAARGMRRRAIIDTLTGLMESAAEPALRDDRWRARMAEIPRLVSSALAKFAPVAVAGDAPIFYHDEADPYAGRKWLVYQMLPERGVALLAGVSRVGKTFAALDLALSVATGTPFAGREIDRQGGTLYLAAEGAAEIPVRWRAAKAGRNCVGKDLPFLWTDSIPCKLLDAGAVERFGSLAEMAANKLDRLGYPLALIVVDTFAVTGGWENENDNAQAQRAMDVLQGLSRTTGALVLAIDHHGKNAEAGTRGASSKGANADATLALLADSDTNGVLHNRRLLVSKNKGGPEGEVMPFELSAITMGHDEKGRPITTCTITWTQRVFNRPKDSLPRDAAAAMLVLHEMGDRAKEDEWREHCDEGRQVSAAPERASRLKAIRRAQHKLLDLGVVRCGGGEIWAVTAPEFSAANAADNADVSGHRPSQSGQTRQPPYKGAVSPQHVSFARH
jgi:hypothetical protein